MFKFDLLCRSNVVCFYTITEMNIDETSLCHLKWSESNQIEKKLTEHIIIFQYLPTAHSLKGNCIFVCFSFM